MSKKIKADTALNQDPDLKDQDGGESIEQLLDEVLADQDDADGEQSEADEEEAEDRAEAAELEGI